MEFVKADCWVSFPLMYIFNFCCDITMHACCLVVCLLHVEGRQTNACKLSFSCSLVRYMSHGNRRDFLQLALAHITQEKLWSAAKSLYERAAKQPDMEGM